MPYHLATSPIEMMRLIEKGVCERNHSLPAWGRKRAGDEARTRDLLLGKEVFYQLNYARTPVILSHRECRETELNCRPCDFQSHALPTELSRRWIEKVLVCENSNRM
jgi:hypothetical protein